jgi:hypothetical protein
MSLHHFLLQPVEAYSISESTECSRTTLSRRTGRDAIHVMDAVRTAGTMLDRLDFHLDYPYLYGSHLPAPRVQGELLSSSRQLRAFSFVEKATWSSQESNDAYEFVTSCLEASASSIQSLAIRLRNENRDLSRTVAKVSYPNLTDVILDRVETDYSTLVSFLGGLPRRMAPLRLYHVYLLDGKWKDALDVIREIRPISFCLLLPRGGEVHEMGSPGENGSIFATTSTTTVVGRLMLRSTQPAQNHMTRIPFRR